MKVLFAIDDSKFSTYALETVGSRPWPANTEFCLLSVLEIGRHEYDGSNPAVVENLKQALDAKAKTLTTLHPGCNVNIRVVQGHAKEAILDVAHDWGANYIVMGSHGRKGVQKLLLGSAAESILGQAPCTVEVVKMKEAHESA